MELLEEVLQFIKEMDAERDFKGNETYLHKKVREAIEANAAYEHEADPLRRRHFIVEKLRELAEKSHGLTASLPTMPVKRWLDGTVADAEKDVFFENVDLAALLRFIADVGVSAED